MSLNDLLTFFKAHGISGILMFILMFLVYVVFQTHFFHEQFIKLINKIFPKKKNSSIVHASNIVNHDMFNYIDFWMYSKIPTLKFASDYKTVIFRKYLSILLSKYKEDVRSYITSKVYETMDDPELWKSILNLLNTIIYDYEREMEAENIPKLIIEKMKDKNNTTITLIIDLTESICSSEFYNSENNLLKIYSIQNILLAVLQNVISNSVVVANEINGDLVGYSILVNGKKVTEKNIDH